MKQNKPKLVFKKMKLNFNLTTGEYNNCNDTIYIKSGMSDYWNRENYFHEMLHRKFHSREILCKKEAVAGLSEEVFCRFAGKILALVKKDFNIKRDTIDFDNKLLNLLSPILRRA